MTEEDDLRAAELALGLLNADEAGRARADGAIALRAEWWRERFEPLLATLAVAPPPDLWAGIERRLAANDNAPAALGRWKALAGGASAIAAALLVYVAARPAPAPVIVTREPPPVVVLRDAPPTVITREVLTGELATREGPAAPARRPAPGATEPAPQTALFAVLSGKQATQVAVAVDEAHGRVRVTPATLVVGRGDAQLWVIPPDGVPRSLGVLAGLSRVTLPAPALLRPHLAAGATLAVSLEPRGGSPTGQPTGPVVATGKLIRS